MTEFLGTDGGQVAGEVTGLTAVAEQGGRRPAGTGVGPGRRRHLGRRVEPGMHPGGLARGAWPAAARRQVHRAQPVSRMGSNMR